MYVCFPSASNSPPSFPPKSNQLLQSCSVCLDTPLRMQTSTAAEFVQAVSSGVRLRQPPLQFLSHLCCSGTQASDKNTVLYWKVKPFQPTYSQRMVIKEHIKYKNVSPFCKGNPNLSLSRRGKLGADASVHEIVFHHKT